MIFLNKPLLAMCASRAGPVVSSLLDAEQRAGFATKIRAGGTTLTNFSPGHDG